MLSYNGLRWHAPLACKRWWLLSLVTNVATSPCTESVRQVIIGFQVTRTNSSPEEEETASASCHQVCHLILHRELQTVFSGDTHQYFIRGGGDNLWLLSPSLSPHPAPLTCCHLVCQLVFTSLLPLTQKWLPIQSHLQ